MFLTFSAPTPHNSQTHSKQFVGNSWRIILKVYNHFMGLALKGLKTLNLTLNILKMFLSDTE